MSSGVSLDYVENYIRSLIGEHTGILRDMECYAAENAVPIVQKEIARFIEFMITIKNPGNILELGTAIGYSSILMKLSSVGDCHITTIERSPDMAKIARENIQKAGFYDSINVIEGECMNELLKLKGRYDLIFIDAGKGHYSHFLPECLRLLDKNGIIIADNVLFRGMIASDKLVLRRKITIVKRMRKYLEMISDGKKFVTSVIPMGDGISITVRRN